MARVCCESCGRDTAAISRKLCGLCAGHAGTFRDDRGRTARPTFLLDDPMLQDEELVVSGLVAYHGNTCRDDI